jgi:hypothetical protein
VNRTYGTGGVEREKASSSFYGFVVADGLQRQRAQHRGVVRQLALDQADDLPKKG